MRAQEGLSTPRQSQLGANRWVRRKRQQWKLGAQASHSLSGIAGGSKGYDGLCIEALGNIAGGIGHHTTLGARNVGQRWNLAAIFSISHDLGHGAHDVLRVDTHGSLTREHNGVSAIENGVSHVGSLCTSRAQVGNHGIQHLGSHDDRLSVLASNLDSALLEQRHALQRHLNAEVATGNHDGIECQHDGLERVYCLRLFQLGNDRNAATLFVHNLVDLIHICWGADEGQCHEVNAEIQSEAQVSDILFRQRRHRDIHTREGNALIIGNWATFGDLTDDVVAVDFLTNNGNLAVVDQQAVTWLGVLRQALVGGGDAVMGAFDIVHGNADDLAVIPLLLAVDKAAKANLRALEVRQDTYGTAGLIGGLAHPVVIRLVVCMLAVRHIQAGNVHAVLYEAQDAVLASNGRAESTNNLRSSIQHYWPIPSGETEHSPTYSFERIGATIFWFHFLNGHHKMPHFPQKQIQPGTLGQYLRR